MPPSTSITKPMIINAVLNSIRKNGEVSITIRSIAGELGCSTQPIYSQFKNMDDVLKHAASNASGNVLEFILNYKQTGFIALDMGLGYLHLCKTDKHLLRFLLNRGESSFNLKQQVEHIKRSDMYKDIPDSVLEDVTRKTWLFVQGIASVFLEQESSSSSHFYVLQMIEAYRSFFLDAIYTPDLSPQLFLERYTQIYNRITSSYEIFLKTEKNNEGR